MSGVNLGFSRDEKFPETGNFSSGTLDAIDKLDNHLPDIEELSGVTDMMAKLDDFLSKNNVDSTACMQKAVCHYIRTSSQHSSAGTTNQVEDMILALSE